MSRVVSRVLALVSQFQWNVKSSLEL
jgi:hypothetical protein